jgi:cyclic 2,3-diphosphoglycerate synthetase
MIALIDGEHHPRVVRDALDRVAAEHELLATALVGGEEKVGHDVLAAPLAHYGHEVTIASDAPAERLRELAATTGADAVIDLSGEPVLGGDERMRIASLALHLGLAYMAPGLELSPPPFEHLNTDRPVLAVIGTGKRTGKTAIAGHWATLLRERGVEPVVVAMGRGGPAEPQLVRAEERPDLARLLAISRSGAHAASDYLEDATLAGVACVGCRRCGEGPAGEPFESNVAAGARLALTLEPDVLLLEGSGAAVPPVEADRTVCVTSAVRARREALSHLGPYRLLRSQLVAVACTGEVDRVELARIDRDLREWAPEATIVAFTLEPEPAQPVATGARAAVFVTAPQESEPELRRRLVGGGVDVVLFSPNLARRGALERDVERAVEERCEVFLTELKAAAIDVVAERAEKAGAPLVFLRNRPRPLDGEPDLDAELLRLFDQARLETPAAQR